MLNGNDFLSTGIPQDSRSRTRQAGGVTPVTSAGSYAPMGASDYIPAISLDNAGLDTPSQARGSQTRTRFRPIGVSESVYRS